jgi:hypothetical protein
MLRDRKVLLEQEIAKLKSEAANVYLSIVVGNNSLDCTEYTALKNRISGLEFDRANLIALIDQGHK